MNLRDQFKKAKLLSDKDARRLAHEARVERKEKGREQLEDEQQSHREQLQQQRDEGRERTAKEQQRLEAERKAREEDAAVDAILAAAQKPVSGPTRFYFEAPDGSLPWLEVAPRQAQQLQAGMFCIVRTGPPGTHDYRLLATEQARRVGRLRPEVVVFGPPGVGG